MLAFKKILVPLDFGPSSEEALRMAIDLAKTFGSELTIIHVWEVPLYAYSGMEFSTIDLLTPARDLAQKQLDEKLDALRKEGANVRGILRSGSAWSEVRSAIDELAPDLVVMGTHGRHGLSRTFLGSVAEKIVRYSASPVLTVREKAPATKPTSTAMES